jgi:hypothetical protein
VSDVKRVPRWPLFLIGAPASIAVWSGWVSLGGLCGFGVVHPLPGIVDGFTVNTAITLPIGVEAYGAYALRAWLTPGTSERARKFAKWSAIGALVLGMAGQAVYHLLAAAHAARAPWPVVMLVSCLPVLVLGLGTALAHLLHEPGEVAPEMVTIPAPMTAGQTVAAVPGDVDASVPVAVLVDGVPTAPVATVRTVATGRALKRASGRKSASPERVFAAEIERGELPSLRAIKSRARCGTPRAREIRDQLALVLREAPEAA